MDETSDEIESHIRDTRANLSANLGELQHKVKAATDWRHLYQKSPGVFLAAAAGGGLLLALLTRGRKSPASRTLSWLPATATAKGDYRYVDHSTVSDIRSALIGMAATEARNALSRWVPGLEQRLAEAAREAKEARQAKDAELADVTEAAGAKVENSEPSRAAPKSPGEGSRPTADAPRANGNGKSHSGPGAAAAK